MTVQQPDDVPDRWREMLDFVGGCVADGLTDAGPGGAPPIGVLQGLGVVDQPVRGDRRLPRDRGAAAAPSGCASCSDPERKARILREHRGPRSTACSASSRRASTSSTRSATRSTTSPTAADSIQGIADATGRRPGRGGLRPPARSATGNQLLYMPLMNYVAGNLDDVREMLLSPYAIMGLSDGGAHCGVICDASFPTTTLVALGPAAARAARSCRSSCWCTT